MKTIKKLKKPKQTLKQTAINLILRCLSKDTYIYFANDAITFHDDTCGQRQHKVSQYFAYGSKIKNHLIVNRVLSFENDVDKGKDNAVLAIIDLDKLNFVSIKENKRDITVEFDLITVYLKAKELI